MEDVVFKVYATENNEQWWASKYKYFLLVFFPPNMMIHSRNMVPADYINSHRNQMSIWELRV